MSPEALYSIKNEILQLSPVQRRRIAGNKSPKPFLKWVGGKSQIIQEIGKNLPASNKYNRYFEPFLGGGAVYFKLIPSEREAILSDVNKNLIGAYLDIRNNLEELLGELQKIESRFKVLKTNQEQAEFYYKNRILYNSIRTPGTFVKRTALLIFLNKTCFNGVYRENSKGEFNVPFGRNILPRILDNENIVLASRKLRNAKIKNQDYREILKNAERGDFIYLDPPYDPISQTANFTKYSKDGFNQSDQENLRDLFVDLHKRGCLVLLSNSNTKLINDLYKKYKIVKISVSRNINCKGQLRKPVQEVLIKNY